MCSPQIGQFGVYGVGFEDEDRVYGVAFGV